MSDGSQSPTSQPKLAIFVVSIIIAILVLILYLPTLSAPALYDEHYLLAWWKNLLQAGLLSRESLAFLSFAGCDLRDGNGPYGNLASLCLVAITAGKIGLIHFTAVALHLGNSLLLFIASLKAQNLAKSGNNNESGDNDETSASNSTDRSLAYFATSAIAALLFALSPLAPEAVSWLGGFPLQIGTTFSLVAFLLLCLSIKDNGKNNSDNNNSNSKNRRSILLSGAAGILAMIASLCSVHLAAVVFFPAVCIYLATRNLASHKNTTRQKTTRLILIVYMIGASAGALYSSFNYLGCSPNSAANPLNPLNLPPKIAALTETKIETQTEVNELSMLSKPLGNLSTLVIPINRSINKNYNKTFKRSYLLIPAPLVFSLVAIMLSLQFRNRIGIALGLALIYLLLNRELIDRETLVGARWLYPILPTFSFLVATTLASPLFIQYKKIESNLISHTIKVLACLLLVVLTLLFLIPLTHTQISSYKSQGKLWAKLSQSIEMLGNKEKSAYLILRNLPQTLSIAPIISPFEPILIDTTEKLPRSQNISAGALKDCLRDRSRDANIGNIAFHFEKHLVDLIKTDFEVTNKNFQPLTAQQIAKRVTPPLEFYHGTVKLDSAGENLLLESGNTNGAAVRINCEGISPVEGDYLYVEAKIDGPPLKPHTPVELHWLTNWNIEWEPRDRKTQIDAFSNDNQYHRYFFPLRSTSWTTNGYPSYIMLGFPAGASVAVRAIGVAKTTVAVATEAKAPETETTTTVATDTAASNEAAKATAETILAPPIPLLTAQACIAQSPDQRRFSAFSFNYPDLKDLGLTAVYGRDNTLILNYDASKIDSAATVKFEIGLGDSKFKADNAEYPDASSTTIDHKDAKGTLVLKDTDQPIAAKTASTGTVFPIRIFAIDQSGKIIGRSSDSVHCLIDWNLSAK